MGVQINGDTGNISATKADYSGNVTIGGTLTYEDVTNIDSVGLVTARSGIEVGARPGVAASISVDGNMIVSGITTIGGVVNASSNVKVGSGVTLSPDGDVFATGVCTATSFSGDGSSLTGIDADKISEGNTEAEVVDTGSDGHFKVTTEGTERIRVGPAGQIGIAGANYGTSGQVLSSQGSGSVVQWATVATDIQFASWRVTTNWSGNVDPIDNFVEKNHNVTMGYSSGIFSFPSTGFWEIMMQTYLYSNANQPNIELHLMTTTNNSSYNTRSQSYSSLHNYSSVNLYTAIQVNHIFDVTDVSTHKVKFKTAGNSANFHTSTSSDESYAIFKRLADT